jgi:Fe-S-cluster containining protein
MNSEKDKDIVCRRCGNCCHVDVAAYVSFEDIRRWEKEGCHDILAHARDNGVMWPSNGFVNRFGSNINTCLMSCVYLKWDGPSASCGIYETRTEVCRSFIPGASDLCPQYRQKPRNVIHGQKITVSSVKKASEPAIP